MTRNKVSANDAFIKAHLDSGRLRVDFETGFVYSVVSNHPNEPLGAKTSKGYLRTSIYEGGKSRTIMVHRIVWIAANGVPDDSGLEIDHINTIKDDNRLCNLELVSQPENMRRAAKNGLCRNNGHSNRASIRDALGRFIRRS